MQPKTKQGADIQKQVAESIGKEESKRHDSGQNDAGESENDVRKPDSSPNQTPGDVESQKHKRLSTKN